MIASLADLLRRFFFLAVLLLGGTVKACLAGRPAAFLRPAARAFRRAEGLMRSELQQDTAEAAGLAQPAMAWLQKEAQGLDRLLGGPPFRVSILVHLDPAAWPPAAALERCLASCLAQAPAELEVLVGAGPELPPSLQAVVEKAVAAGKGRLHGGVPGDPAALVVAARHEWLLFADPAGWLRPDLLYRYHQLLVREPGGERMLGCAGWPLDAKGEVKGPPNLATSARPHPPFVFATGELESAVLLPATRAEAVAVPGGRPLDWALAVAAGGCQLLSVPVPLCARPAPAQNTEGSLRRYLASLGLPWRVEEGGRIRPALPAPMPSVQVVMPFRDQPALTRAAAKAVLEQAWPGVELVAVDNGSEDAGLGRELEMLGAKVLRRDEPFNFSRLVNAAIAGRDSELVLLLNNDVELEPGALAELAVWAMQEGAGLVGPALFYPDGKLQHGGLELDPAGRAAEMPWVLVERGWPEAALKEAARLRVVDGVSGACAMVRRAVLAEIGGLDEVFYPNAFSDTDLALRISRLGLVHVYTPFARGVHHESASRPGDRREDFEGSAWLHRHLGREGGCGS